MTSNMVAAPSTPPSRAMRSSAPSPPSAPRPKRFDRPTGIAISASSPGAPNAFASDKNNFYNVDLQTSKDQRKSQEDPFGPWLNAPQDAGERPDQTANNRILASNTNNADHNSNPSISNIKKDYDMHIPASVREQNAEEDSYGLGNSKGGKMQEDSYFGGPLPNIR